MVKILLYSKNKKNSAKITRILKNKNYQLQAGSLADIKNGSGGLSGAELAIFDIAGQDNAVEDYNKNIIRSVNRMAVGKLMILPPGRLKSLLGKGIDIDDFIFYQSIDSELISRIEFLLSRNKTNVPKNSIVVGTMVLNQDKYELTVDKAVIELTYKEFELLKILLQNQNKVLTRNNLFSTVWGYDFYGGSRTVDVHIRRLRSKIPSPYNLMIKTIRNVGYMFSSQI